MVKRKRRKIKPKDRIRDFNKKKSNKNLPLNILLLFSLILVIYLLYPMFKSDKVEIPEVTQNNEEKAEKKEDKKTDEKIVYKIEVLNGCGISGVAAKFTNFIRQNGFDVIETRNYVPLGETEYNFDVRETIVIDRSGKYNAALEIASILGTDNVIKQLSKEAMVDVTVIIGKDCRNLAVYK